MTTEEFVRAKNLEAKEKEKFEYMPKYYIEGVVHTNDLDALSEFADFLYFTNAKTVRHIKKIRAMAEGQIPKQVELPLHIYWYEGIGYAESMIKNDDDAALFNEEYWGTISNGYDHAVDFSGFISEANLNVLIWQIKELSKKFSWAYELSNEIGEYSDSNEDCDFELKIEGLEDDDDEVIA